MNTVLESPAWAVEPAMEGTPCAALRQLVNAAGPIACGVALVLNIVLIIAGMSLMSATLTMPGIAAMVLTMGIAVDANVLIYERIREELRDGQTPHASIEAGYDRAFLTIADANVTVLIGTLVLFVMGAGPVKGFAITLSLGILTSQFTSIVGTRSLAYLVFAKRKLKDLPIW